MRPALPFRRLLKIWDHLLGPAAVHEPRRVRLGVEPMEDRTMLTAVPLLAPGGGSWSKVDTITIATKTNQTVATGVQSAVTLEAGKTYLAVASGTARIATDTTGFADAEFIRYNKSTGPQDGSSAGYPWANHGVRLAGVPGGDTTGNLWGGYQADHQYVREFVGQGTTVTGYYVDAPGYYGDNSGSLTVDIYAEVPNVTVEWLADAVEGGSDGAVQFTRTGDTSQPLRVTYTTEGLFPAGLEEIPLAEYITFEAGESTAVAPVVALNDDLREVGRILTVTLYDDWYYNLGASASALVGVTDNDAPEPDPWGDAATASRIEYFDVLSGFALGAPPAAAAELVPSSLFVRIDQAAAWAARLSAPGEVVLVAPARPSEVVQPEWEYTRLILPESARNNASYERIRGVLAAAGLPGGSDASELEQAIRALYRGGITNPPGHPDRFLTVGGPGGRAQTINSPNFFADMAAERARRAEVKQRWSDRIAVLEAARDRTVIGGVISGQAAFPMERGSEEHLLRHRRQFVLDVTQWDLRDNGLLYPLGYDRTDLPADLAELQRLVRDELTAAANFPPAANAGSVLPLSAYRKYFTQQVAAWEMGRVESRGRDEFLSAAAADPPVAAALEAETLAFVKRDREAFEQKIAGLPPAEQAKLKAAVPWLYANTADPSNPAYRYFRPQLRLTWLGTAYFSFEPTTELKLLQVRQAQTLGTLRVGNETVGYTRYRVKPFVLPTTDEERMAWYVRHELNMELSDLKPTNAPGLQSDTFPLLLLGSGGLAGIYASSATGATFGSVARAVGFDASLNLGFEAAFQKVSDKWGPAAGLATGPLAILSAILTRKIITSPAVTSKIVWFLPRGGAALSPNGVILHEVLTAQGKSLDIAALQKLEQAAASGTFKTPDEAAAAVRQFLTDCGADTAALTAEQAGKIAKVAGDVFAVSSGVVGRTVPSGAVNNPSNRSGDRTKVPANESPENQRALTLENEAADTLAAGGYKVHQNPDPPQGSTKNPDYLIEGKYFDNYAPTTKNPDRIAEHLMEKPGKGQATRVVLSLDDVPGLDLAKFRESVEAWRLTPGSGMDKIQEIIIIRNGQIIPFYPW